MTGNKSDGRQVRWQQHNDERRRRIVAAAISVIEESEPGADLQVQQIAERAGVGRTVLYRHFNDRADLQHAVQQEVLDRFWAELLPLVSLRGTVPEIVERIIGTYVHWAVAHPSLHRLADHDATDDGTGPLQDGLDKLAAQIGMVITAGAVALGGDLTEEDQAGIDPLVFALVGAVFGAVRRWLAVPDNALSAERLIEMISQSVWLLIDGHARRLGVVIDPDLPLEQLLDTAPSDAS